MSITSGFVDTDKAIMVFIAIPNENVQDTVEADLRQNLTSVHIVKFNDGQSLIKDLQKWSRKPDIIFFNHPLAEDV